MSIGIKVVMISLCRFQDDLQLEERSRMEIMSAGSGWMMKRANVVRAQVSKKKKRYKADGFDLDLTYITERVIAMGCPSESLESIYRNPIGEVKKFFETYHPGHYKIFNLCSERMYNIEKFDGRVALFPFDDHNCPSISLIEQFVLSVEEWLNADKDNVVGVHCKAGKGRTGVMLCCWMLYTRLWTKAKDCLDFYGFVRCEDSKGVTIPSQKRVVHYFEEIVTLGPRPEVTLGLTHIIFRGIPNFDNFIHPSCSPYFKISQDNKEIYTSPVFPMDPHVPYTKDKTLMTFSMPNVTMTGMYKIEVIHKKERNAPIHMFHFWMHTSFIQKLTLILPKRQLDKACKDKRCKKFPADFEVELRFKNSTMYQTNKFVGNVIYHHINLGSSVRLNLSTNRKKRGMSCMYVNLPSIKRRIGATITIIKDTFYFLTQSMFEDYFVSEDVGRDAIFQIAATTKIIKEVVSVDMA
eukprot:TRINITY_DN6064_c0_g1_i6.p1 TRINITY_DN6064_c0_g1~~TRINITY_DN6064_c0_g1_i6.p1  ORF type:complete len:465 (-),score=131.04 TRINITY_DN6064_c0_g1_i6:798-2192(-)